MLLQPRLIVTLRLNHDTATHLRVPDATEASAENLECPGSDGGDPEVGDQTWHQIHLGPELGHIKVVHDVYGAEQYLDRLPERQGQIAAFGHHTVPPPGTAPLPTPRAVQPD